MQANPRGHHPTQVKHAPAKPIDPPPSAERSAIMRSVGQKDTGPELIVRRAVHALGFRFRLHRRDLPGTPDLVLPRLKKVIFVHGCFWHRHEGCRRTTSPKTRKEYWDAKFARNIERDINTVEALSRHGWQVLIVWECETADAAKLSNSLMRFLDTSRRRFPSNSLTDKRLLTT